MPPTLPPGGLRSAHKILGSKEYIMVSRYYFLFPIGLVGLPDTGTGTQ